MKSIPTILLTAHRKGLWEGLLCCLAWQRAAGADLLEPSEEDRAALALFVPTVTSPEESGRVDEPHGVIDEGLILKQLERRRRAIARELGHDGLPRNIDLLTKAGALLTLDKARAKMARLEAELEGIKDSIRLLERRPAWKIVHTHGNVESTAALAGPRGVLN